MLGVMKVNRGVTDWQPNTRRKPPLPPGSVVDVRLRSGEEYHGWPIDGKGACEFRFRDFRADIIEWRYNG